MAAQLACQVTPQPAAAIATRDYRCFSSLPLFAVASPNLPAASPKLAAAWADAILIYWQNAIASGSIDQSKPLYLLDLAPQNGQMAWLLLAAIQQRLKTNALDLDFCYLNCYNSAASAAHHAEHPYFSELIADERIDFVHWDKAGDALHLQRQKSILQHSDNPLVILGLGYFQTLESELIGIHNGQITRGSAAVTASADSAESANPADAASGNTYEFSYHWQAADAAATIPIPAEPLLAHYRHHCNGSAILLPLTACATLDMLNQFAFGRTLLLAADPGVSNEQQVRLGALSPPIAWCADDPAAPVNFHALSLYQQQYGAWIWQQQLDDEGAVLHMAWRDDIQPVPQHDFKALAAKLAEAHPDDIRTMVATRHNAAETLALLRLSHYDPQLLKANIAAFIAQPLELSDSARRNWQTALVRTWCNFLPQSANDGFYYQVGLMAAQLGHFGLAKDCFRQGLGWYGDEVTDLYLLAWCEAASGGVAHALELLAHALTLDPEHAHAMTLQASLQERLARWQKNPWYLPHTAHADTLQLEPLGHEHAPTLLYQYRDRQIGIMTRLPELETTEQVQDWINEQAQDQDRASFAVMHECWGFVGVVSIHCAGDTGYFYFWIGSDFQDQGLGQQAAQLLFGMMAEHGVTQIFTSAYEDNLRSIHALTRLGFSKLAMRAKEPDETLAFFHLGQCDTQADPATALPTALSRLCRAIASPLAFLQH